MTAAERSTYNADQYAARITLMDALDAAIRAGRVLLPIPQARLSAIEPRSSRAASIVATITKEAARS